MPPGASSRRPSDSGRAPPEEVPKGLGEQQVEGPVLPRVEPPRDGGFAKPHVEGPPAAPEAKAVLLLFHHPESSRVDPRTDFVTVVDEHVRVAVGNGELHSRKSLEQTDPLRERAPGASSALEHADRTVRRHLREGLRNRFAYRRIDGARVHRGLRPQIADATPPVGHGDYFLRRFGRLFPVVPWKILPRLVRRSPLPIRRGIVTMLGGVRVAVRRL